MSTATVQGPTADDFKQWAKKWRHDLAGFVRNTWKVDPDIWQEEVSDWLGRDGTRQIAIPSGHGVGKTAWAAWAAIWFVLTRYPCKVVLTAPSASTLEDGLLVEIKMWIERLPSALKKVLEVRSDRIVLASKPEMAFISARTARADKPEALQGVHQDYVLLIVDEAAGVPDPVFEASSGSMSGPARYMVLLGNPTRADGYFHDAITKGAGTTWRVRRVSCMEAKRSPQTYIDMMAETYGEESNVFRTRVLGLPPTANDDTIIPLDLVHDALEREVHTSSFQPIVWGLDVARLGQNESAMAKRQGAVLLEKPARYRGLNLMQLCGRIAAEYEGLPQTKRPSEICVDGIGLGAGVVDRLRELGLPASSVNVSEQLSHNPMYYNLKAELWWKARGWYESRDCKIPKDEGFIRALTCVREDHHSTGKLMVESKDSLARRMKKHLPPLDAADAFVLTFAAKAAAAMYGKRRLKVRGQAMRRNLRGVV